MLVGRAAETAAIDDLLAAARAGRSGVLVIRGEPGIGKSTLLDYAVAHADGMDVLRAAGVEGESELPFGALHQILRPLFGRIGRLPEPQAAALRAAFALSDETVNDRFRVSLAVLGLLADASEERPVLCVVDDAQWLDDASVDALVFAARRLEAEAVALIVATREHAAQRFGAANLPELSLASLRREDARAVVVESLGANAASDIVEWLLDGANGNPLALVELPASLTPEQRTGRGPLDRALLPPTSVEEAYFERVTRLPEAARRILLLAAAEGSGDRATVMRAGADLGLEVGELAAAEAEGLVRVGPDRIEFRHPLARSAVYRGAGFAARDEAHEALARALTAEGDADRRAWHRAAATVGANEEVAAELEQSAGRARLRAGYAAVSAALERASDLTADAAERGRRLALAAVAANLAGRGPRAIALTDRADPIVADPVLRGDLADVRASAEMMSGRPAAAADIFTAEAGAVAPHDAGRALDLACAGVQAAVVSGDPQRIGRATALGEVIAPEPGDAVQLVLSSLLRGSAHVFGGDPVKARPLMEAALAGAERLTDPRQIIWCAVAARQVGDDPRARLLYARGLVEARRTGEMRVLAYGLAGQAVQSVVARKLGDAATQADESVRLARDLGMENTLAQSLAVLAWLDAFHGREDECRRRAGDVLGLATARGLALQAATATWAIAELELGLGRWDEAFAALQSLADVRPGFGNPLMALSSTPDRVEAAVRAGRTEEAVRGSLGPFETWAEATPAPWARAQLARCRALLAPAFEEAARHFEEALRLHAEDADTFAAGRTALLYGERLRRERRRTEARVQLRTAVTAFEQLGAVLWAERARGELRATGETARARDPGTVAQLTAQELQIARLVSEGASNKEVAAQLFLSPRTVEYHLRKVFTKLGIASRSELIRHGVGDAAPEPAGVT